MISLKNFQLPVMLVIFFLALTVPAYASSQKFIAISTGETHTLALADDGTVWTWGNISAEDNRQYGNQSIRIHQVQISGVIAIAAGGDHSLALKNDGTVWAWGINDYGQLGDGTTETRYTPVQVMGISNVTEISAGLDYSVALKSDGTVWTWGYNKGENNDSRLGDGTIENRFSPVQVKGLTDVKNIMGQFFAIKEDGTVWAWGNALNMTNSTVPFQVPGLKNIKKIDMDYSYGHALFIKEDGTIWAWGFDNGGEFGNGTFMRGNPYITEPVQAKGLTDIKAVSAGFGTSMALKNDGTVWVWGQNGAGELGTGTIGELELTPVMIQGLNGVVAISSKNTHSAFLKEDGSIWMCGNNDAGQIGNSSDIEAHTTVFAGIVSYIGKPIKILGPGTDMTSTTNTTSNTSNSSVPTTTMTNNSTAVVNAGAISTQNDDLLNIVVIVCALILIGGCIVYFGVIRKL